MNNARIAPEADVILGAFARTPDAQTEPCESCQSRPPCEVIALAPFLTTRRRRSASATPTSDPA